MPNYHLIESADLAKMGMVSEDKLTQALGKDLADHVEELEAFKEAMYDAQAKARVYQYQVIPPLHAEIERLTAILNEKA